MTITGAQIASKARAAGYELTRVEQLRPNRWLITLRNPDGSDLLVLAQHRPMLLAADVHDLAELLRLRRVASGCLLAVSGRFSSEALRTAQELRTPRIQLCADLPPARSGAVVPSALETV